MSYVKPYWKVFALSVLGMVAASATEPLLPALLKPLLDKGFGAGEAAWSPLTFAVLIVGIMAARGIFTFTSSYFLNWVSSKVVLDLREAMFSRLLRFPAKYFDDNTSGALLSKVAYDVTNVTAAATNVLTVVVKDSLAIVGLLGFLFYVDWKLTLIALAIAPPIAWTVRMVSHRLRRMSRESQRQTGELVNVLQEAIECHKVVKVFGGQDYEAGRFRHGAQALRGFTMRAGTSAAMTTPITHIFAAVALSIIIYIAMQDSLANRTTIGTFAAFVAAMMMLLAPLKRITEINTPLQRGLAAAESVFEMIDAPVEHDTGTVKLGRARGELTFERVRLTYPTRKEPALDGIDLQIRPGETVALVGPSGGGKTTLVNLLPRFYSPDGGRVLLDGHDLQALTLDTLRANVALVSQEVVLFNDSIFANIAYGGMGGASEKEVVAAAEAAHAMSFIRETPEGLNTLIGENGLRLSGGQRQRLAIARALLKNAPVLLLDEATSALDSESERAVQAALDVLMRGRTTVVIAHRLSTIERADRIAVLDRGRVVELGRHAELLAAEGVYARLYRTQYAAERAAA
jgi:subfamily B ATP-binding cassette protein MsbA